MSLPTVAVPLTLSLLSEGQEAQAVEVLTTAFADDPLLQRLASMTDQSYNQNADALFRYACRVRTLLGWPLVGAWVGDELVGVAVISLPALPAWSAPLLGAYRDLKETLGPTASDFLERIAALADRSRPEDPHFVLGTVGVLPAWQRSGVGTALLDWLHLRVDAHPEASGVWLETENPQNIQYYAQFGYDVIGESYHQDLTIWAMFRRRED